MPAKDAKREDKRAPTSASTRDVNTNVAVRRSVRTATAIASAVSLTNSETLRAETTSKASTQRRPRDETAAPVLSHTTDDALAATERPSAFKVGRAGGGTAQTLQVGFNASVLQAQPELDNSALQQSISMTVSDHVAPIFRNQEFCNFLGQEYANAHKMQTVAELSSEENEDEDIIGESKLIYSLYC